MRVRITFDLDESLAAADPDHPTGLGDHAYTEVVDYLARTLGADDVDIVRIRRSVQVEMTDEEWEASARIIEAHPQAVD